MRITHVGVSIDVDDEETGPSIRDGINARRLPTGRVRIEIGALDVTIAGTPDKLLELLDELRARIGEVYAA